MPSAIAAEALLLQFLLNQTLIHNNIMTNEQIKQRIIAIIDTYTQEMECYNYYGSNPGVSKNDYEKIANDILKEFEVIG